MRENISHIWVGRFSPSAPAHYFEAQREDPDAPMCQFAVDQDKNSFDYDFVEISYIEEMKDVRSFIKGHSYWETYIEKVVSMAADLKVTEINVFVLADKQEFRTPQSVFGNDFDLWYLGEFNCER